MAKITDQKFTFRFKLYQSGVVLVVVKLYGVRKSVDVQLGVYYLIFTRTALLIESTTQLQDGAFALAFKSRHFPGQLVATRRGSPLLIGIKSDTRVSATHFPISFSKGETRTFLQ